MLARENTKFGVWCRCINNIHLLRTAAEKALRQEMRDGECLPVCVRLAKCIMTKSNKQQCFSPHKLENVSPMYLYGKRSVLFMDTVDSMGDGEILKVQEEKDLGMIIQDNQH